MSEPPIITFIRGATLLAALIALPGIAVCWNHLPKDIWHETKSEQSAPKVGTTQPIQKKSDQAAWYVSEVTPESSYPALLEPAIASEFSVGNIPVQPLEAPPNTAVQQVSWEPSRTGSTQDFESLGTRLEALGTTYYKVEKWGNRGELFRVSCFVTPAGSPTDGRHTYEKHFQAIGSDVVTVMQSVIADIERWKNVR